MNASEFLKNLPAKIKPELLEGLETIFHFDLEEEGQYTVYIKDNQVTVDQGLCDEPKCVVKAKPETLMKIVNGDMNPMMAVMTGKIKISNPGEMIKYAKVFGLM
ncbi:MAG: SCP2 sterol-binding domain-containing protein [Saprospiraceae bacterium]